MKYFIDTEFLEGTQDKRFLGIKYGETKPTLDLISIGIVCEDGREYYAISKDFNLHEAWNRYDLKPDINNGGMKKVYWIRENVLKPIWKELSNWDEGMFYVNGDCFFGKSFGLPIKGGFTYRNIEKLIQKYGKTNKQIAEDLKEIVSVRNEKHTGTYPNTYAENVEFYAYYADYDWVAFCWLFGKMIDLPNGFPMLAFDIQQQILEYKIDKEQLLKEVPQINCHNALQDAIWNYNAYKWIQNKINNGK